MTVAERKNLLPVLLDRWRGDTQPLPGRFAVHVAPAAAPLGDTTTVAVAARLLREREALVFDLDGTLVDSAADVRHTLGLALADCGLPPGLAQGMVDLHSPLDVIVHAVLEPAGQEPALAAAVLAAYGRRVAQSRFERSVPYPGVLQLLLDALARGQRLAVCTNKRHAEALRMLEQFRMLRLFDVVVGAESADRPKPDPAPLQLVLASVGVEPEDAVLVGDTHVDAQCAQRAGVDFVWHRGGYGLPRTAQMRMAGSFGSYEALREAPRAS